MLSIELNILTINFCLWGSNAWQQQASTTSVNSFSEWKKKNGDPGLDKELLCSLRLQKALWKMSFGVAGIFWLFIEREQDREFEKSACWSGSEEQGCSVSDFYAV